MKAALLTSLAYRPELIVLDEPFTGLDPMVRDELVRALLELPGERPCTMLISSHDIEEVERLADWIGFIDRGQLALAEPVDSLLRRVRLIEVTGGDAALVMPRDARNATAASGSTPHARPSTTLARPRGTAASFACATARACAVGRGKPSPRLHTSTRQPSAESPAMIRRS